MKIDMESRYRGCLLGLAVGDAVGTTLEFARPGTFEPIDDMIGGGPFGLRPGQWTDDTSLALCLGESLLECAGFNPIDQLQRYLRWWREGHLSSTGSCFDIGSTTRTALGMFERTGQAWSGPTDPDFAGNGSLMRLAPVPMFYACQFSMAIERAAESSRTTHGAQTAVDACRYFAGLVTGALSGTSKDELLSSSYSPIPGYWKKHALAPEIDEVARGSFRNHHPPQIRGTGFVVRTLEAALWAFYNTSSFRDGCLGVVNLGEDADTTGAVYGQLAGAYYGVGDIPEKWLKRLYDAQLITSMADKLYRHRATCEAS
jgi:ADP-ribosylglycohydrolase